MNFLKISRSNVWWNIVVPQVLGWIYFCLLASDFVLAEVAVKMCFFFIALICISAFGYIFNDYWDQETDALSGKENLLSLQHSWVKFLLINIPLCCGVTFWFLIGVSLLANIFFALQIVSLVFYSMPPFRFKNRAMLGVAADAFYGHINPVLVTLFTFSFIEPANFYKVLLVGVILICTTLKGVRNILLHQIEDRKKDYQSGIHTFVTQKGGLFSLNLINRILLLEAFFTLLLVILISIYFPPFLISLVVFSCITYLKFSGWKLAYLPRKQLKFKFLFFLNDYYEEWMPVFFLIILCVRLPEFLFLLPLHLVLFPSFIVKLLKDLKIIRNNLNAEEDY